MGGEKELHGVWAVICHFQLSPFATEEEEHSWGTHLLDYDAQPYETMEVEECSFAALTVALSVLTTSRNGDRKSSLFW